MDMIKKSNNNYNDNKSSNKTLYFIQQYNAKEKGIAMGYLFRIFETSF